MATGILSNIPEANGVMTTEDTRLVMIAGKPISEPLVQYDAMNAREKRQGAYMTLETGGLPELESGTRPIHTRKT